MAEYTCIVCPLSCHLTVSEGQDGTISVSGNGCKRGEEHGKMNILNPYENDYKYRSGFKPG